ncbi:MAG: dethiobiotin synthase [Xanthobacteraceae bacterium]|uniref:dethiobiotin synthase n=1 Tax=Pseudolabrys sp. TaxID=1960880 RepID=UPI003D0B58EF
MSAVFVTSTGTDIGKTFITAGLVRLMREQGASVDALKPVVSGYDSSTAATSDPAVLLAALGRPVTAETIGQISPWRYRAPLSPDVAAAREGGHIDVPAVIDLSRKAIARAGGTLLIEGVGGVMVPLDGKLTVLDWIEALEIPALLVVGSYLGSISHTLTTLQVLADRKVPVAAIVISESERSAVPLDDTADSIARFAGDTPVIAMPRLPKGVRFHAAFHQIARLL